MYWIKQTLQFSVLMVLFAAVVMIVPNVWAHHNTGLNAQDMATVRDILKDPQHYLGETVTLEGEVDHVHSPTAFFMENDQNILFEGSPLLVVSVMRDVRVDGELKEGKLVKATGVVRMFKRDALENEFGPLDWGLISLEDLNKYESEDQPVLVMGTSEFAARRLQQQQQQQLVIVTPPAPITPQPQDRDLGIQTQPAPAPAEPAIREPVQERETETIIQDDDEFERDTMPVQRLPRTATPLPLVGLLGLLSLALGFGIGFRK